MQDEKELPAKTLADLKNKQLLELSMPDQKIDMFSSHGFALAQRIAQAFVTSDAVPSIFQKSVAKKDKGVIVAWVDNPAAFGNCLVAIETAQAVGMSITAVMQNANIIEGKLSWSGKFIIAAVNASRRFTPLRFDIQETGMIKAAYKEKDGWNKEKNKWNMVEHSVDLENIVWRAWALPFGMDFPKGVVTLQQAKDAGLPVIVGPRVSMRLAVEEGWYAKAGSKWQTEMRDLMGMYRAGAYFGNIHAPDVVMGMGRSTEEHQDMSTIDVERQPNGQYAATNLDDLRRSEPAQSASQERHRDAETVVVSERQQEDAGGLDDAEPTKTETKAEKSETNPAESGKKPAINDSARAAYESVAAQIHKALNLDSLAEAADLIKSVQDDGLRDELGRMYKTRYAELDDSPRVAVQKEAAPAARQRRTTATKAPGNLD